jgi:hypothetical protein
MKNTTRERLELAIRSLRNGATEIHDGVNPENVHTVSARESARINRAAGRMVFVRELLEGVLADGE